MGRPAWFNREVAAWLAGGCVIVAVALSFGTVRSDAAEGRDGVRDLKPRVTTVETQQKNDGKVLDEIRADVKELLRRVK